MKPDKKTVTFHVDTGTCPDVLERELSREGYSPEEIRDAIEELVADGTLTRGRNHPRDPGVWIVVTEWSPRMAATIREIKAGR